MNAVEIEEQVSSLAATAFDASQFPFRFLEAFDFNATTINKLKTGGKGHNKSDVPGGFLTGHRNNIHLATSAPGKVGETLRALLASPATLKHKAKFVLATDGNTIEAQNLADEAEPPLVCDYANLGDHFGYFLGLAGISTVKAIRENAFDIKATGRLNRLYVELIRHNSGWEGADRRENLNHFFARLIFCFFAEHTGIFEGQMLFTNTVQQMTDPNGSNTAAVLSQIFQVMDLPHKDRAAAKLRPWAEVFPYVNGGLFSGAVDNHDVPQFTKIARSYLLHAGSLDWTKINPDIFGSMIQAVADDSERGALGMHYTSVPNILKVINPLFLDNLRQKLAEAGDGKDQGSRRKLQNLLRRISRIRVFDPACGSGNFLVIAYKELRVIEAEINRRRGEPHRDSEIPLTNFRGIELRHFAAEIARLALIIAEFQCNALHLGERKARLVFLPLEKENRITCGNALRLDWLQICPPNVASMKIAGDDLFDTPLDQAEIDSAIEGGETYICGNPPYKGQSEQNAEQKADLEYVFANSKVSSKLLDYVSGWLFKFCSYTQIANATAAFVSTNSICQGQQVSALWPHLINRGLRIIFARTSFKWRNLASNNAGVTVIVVGLARGSASETTVYTEVVGGEPIRRDVSFIGPYLVPNSDVIVYPSKRPLNGLHPMDYGSKPADDGGLILEQTELLSLNDPIARNYIQPYVGSSEFITGSRRYCLWVNKEETSEALKSPFISGRARLVADFRSKSKKKQTRDFATYPLRFAEVRHSVDHAEQAPLIIPIHTAEDRDYLPVGALPRGTVVSNAAYGIYDAPLWNLSLIASHLHLVWIATVCGKIKIDYRYSNTLGWNTFPIPPLSEANRAELTRRAEDILLAREAYWPATISEMYEPKVMDVKYPELRSAHDRNDESIERIYIGRRFKNDTERLEKLFELYTRMTAKLASMANKHNSRKKKDDEA